MPANILVNMPLQRGLKKAGTPKASVCHEPSRRRARSSSSACAACGTSSDRRRQKSSSAAAAWPGLAAMMTPLKAPIDTPAMTSGWMRASSSARATPHSKAPSAPPPCRISAVWLGMRVMEKSGSCRRLQAQPIFVR